jgi:hypothetical protein
MSERWPMKLSVDKLEQIAARTGVREVLGDDGGPHRRVMSAMDGSQIGQSRVFLGDDVVKKVVYHEIAVEQIGLDSHMIFAFTDEKSPIPHWTFDSVVAFGNHAFHLDLIPRVDLGANLTYMDGIYGRITEAFEKGLQQEGLSEAAIGPRQRAVMSPWMLAYRVDEELYPTIDVHVQAYLDAWFTMLEEGIDPAVAASVDPAQIAERDRANRAMIFSRAVDAVWDQITPLMGMDQSEQLRLDLVTNSLEHPAPASA